MQVAAAFQVLSFGILAASGVVLIADFVRARRQLTRAIVAWRMERGELR